MTSASHGRVAHARHLVSRFAGSLSRRPPGAAAAAWALGHLSPAEAELWMRLGPADQRHSIAVARATIARLFPAAEGGEQGGAEVALVAGALLHDIGKLDTGLGVTGRVVATVWRAARGPAALVGQGAVARYLRHEQTGAEWCRARGSDPMVVALVGRTAAARVDWLAALIEADDGLK